MRIFAAEVSENPINQNCEAKAPKKPAPSDDFQTLLSWADKHRKLKVRANADTPQDAAKARELGAEGIGLAGVVEGDDISAGGDDFDVPDGGVAGLGPVDEVRGVGCRRAATHLTAWFTITGR